MNHADQPAPGSVDQDDWDRPTLLCVPHAGGAARVYAKLGPALPQAEVVPLELPGHGVRMNEPVKSDLSAVIEDLVVRTAPHVRRPYVLLGHSMGAAIAFELARHWSAWGRPPAALVLASRNGPGAAPTYPAIHGLDTPSFLAGIRRLGGTPPQVFDNPELIRLFTPLLRADFTISETYRPLPGGTLDCPMWLCAGVDDPMADEQGMRDWARFTTGEVIVEQLPGGHFILDDLAFQRFVARALTGRRQTAAIAIA